MPSVIWTLHDGEVRTVGAEIGESLMANAVRSDIVGIDAQCGGALCCATCHVYVDPDWWARLPAPRDDEIEMLARVAAERRPTSRLACQIVLTGDIVGLRVAVPETQVPF